MLHKYAKGDSVIRISDKQEMTVSDLGTLFIRCMYVGADGVFHSELVSVGNLKPTLIVSGPMFKEQAKGNGGGEEFVEIRNIYDNAEPGNCNSL